MMLKAQKVEYVKNLQEEMKRYKVVGVMPTTGLPDRLLQRVRNGIKPDGKVIIARKSLILRALEFHKGLEGLKPFVEKNTALILTNTDPFELYKKVASNKLKLSAKPGQISPGDINVEAGETAIAPGQAVTDLKAAGIDVQIQKGKVVISKSKVLVQKGQKISRAVAKGLKMLEITPFEVAPRLSGLISGNLLFSEEVLGISQDSVAKDIGIAFSSADYLTTQIGYVTTFNIPRLLTKAYYSALGLGLSAKLYEPGIVEKLISQAMAEAVGLKARVPKAASEATAPAEPAKESKEEPKGSA